MTDEPRADTWAELEMRAFRRGLGVGVLIGVALTSVVFLGAVL